MADEDVSTKRRNFATRSLASWYKMLEVGQGAPKVSLANFKSPQLATSGYFLMATDSGVQYLSIRYTERLGDAEIVASVGSKGDSNALAESFNGLYKNELIHRKGPWRNVERVARLYDTIREVRRVRCAHRLKTPNDLVSRIPVAIHHQPT
jgi:hypothetical protein